MPCATWHGTPLPRALSPARIGPHRPTRARGTRLRQPSTRAGTIATCRSIRRGSREHCNGTSRRAAVARCQPRGGLQHVERRGHGAASSSPSRRGLHTKWPNPRHGLPVIARDRAVALQPRGRLRQPDPANRSNSPSPWTSTGAASQSRREPHPSLRSAGARDVHLDHADAPIAGDRGAAPAPTSTRTGTAWSRQVRQACRRRRCSQPRRSGHAAHRPRRCAGSRRSPRSGSRGTATHTQPSRSRVMPSGGTPRSAPHAPIDERAVRFDVERGQASGPIPASIAGTRALRCRTAQLADGRGTWR